MAYSEWWVVSKSSVEGVSDGHVNGDLVKIVLKNDESGVEGGSVTKDTLERSK